MNYLITGGAGFIGSHLADYLIRQGHSVHAVDNLSTGRMSNIQHLLESPQFSYSISSVLDYHSLEKHVESCDFIFHLAAAVGVKLIMEEPVETIVTNVQGTENVLKLANYHKKKVLIASSSEIYGKSMDLDGDVTHLTENADWTLGPTTKRRWAYACSKAMDEFLARAYYEEKRLPVVIARFFNTVGPRQSGQYGMVIPNFVRCAVMNEPIRVYGDGTQSRCFIHVRDVVRIVSELIELTDAEGEVFNIGRPEPMTMNELAERVREIAGSSSEIVHVPYGEVYGEGFEDMQSRTPDVSKLERMVDVEPLIGIDEIIGEVVGYFEAGQSDVLALTENQARSVDNRRGDS